MMEITIDDINENENVGDIKDEDKDKKENNNVPSWINQFLSDTTFYMKLFIFMMTDFYIRSIPLICLLALIPCNADEQFCPARNVTFCLLFLGLLLFEFIMNYRMRIQSYSSTLFIFQIFGISIFSSFHSLLSALSIFKDDPFYGKSVEFRSLMVEHKCRTILSVLVNITCVGLLGVNGGKDRFYVIILLLILYLICLFGNMKVIRFLRPYTS